MLALSLETRSPYSKPPCDRVDLEIGGDHVHDRSDCSQLGERAWCVQRLSSPLPVGKKSLDSAVNLALSAASKAHQEPRTIVRPADYPDLRPNDWLKSLPAPAASGRFILFYGKYLIILFKVSSVTVLG